MKTNEEVLDLVKENRILLNNLKSRQWHMITDKTYRRTP